ncbi:MAG: phenylalanine--tRNA ligase beta subunit-related protein [Thermoanaerobaculia bacterium]|nr:phenylalanine--tRNA ligase beta subunit-related protein [Thermoanaerobaculia bacterium]
MKLSLAWLREHVELPEAPAEVAARLTAIGHSVEAIEGEGDAAVLDVDVTTNRPDCMNHRGLARELAAAYGRPLRPLPESPAGPATPAPVAVSIEDAAGCSRYVALALEGVEVRPSPEWLVRRLESIGLRAINNVVDVTNYVLWDLGQPLHAFDLDRLGGGEVRVRRARAGERLVTLDGAERTLDPEVLVIADRERPVALAGIMGGRESEVGAATRRVLLESAHFDRRRVRRAARALGMHTDASHRFERGADPEICRLAAERAAALLAECAGARPAAPPHDERAAAPAELRWRLEGARLDAFAGAPVPPGAVEGWLAALGFGPQRSADGGPGRGSSRRSAPRTSSPGRSSRGGGPSSRLGRPTSTRRCSASTGSTGSPPPCRVWPGPTRVATRSTGSGSGCATTSPTAASRRRSTSPSTTAPRTPASRGAARPATRSPSPTRSPSATRCCGARCCPTWSRRPASTAAGAPPRSASSRPGGSSPEAERRRWRRPPCCWVAARACPGTAARSSTCST